MSGILHKQVGSDRVAAAFAQALAERDAEQVRYALLQCERYELTSACLEPLHALVVATWHTWHEALIIILMRFDSPSRVEPLYQAARLAPPHPGQEHRAAARAIIALRCIRSPQAIERLAAIVADRHERPAPVRRQAWVALEHIASAQNPDPATRELAQRTLAEA